MQNKDILLVGGGTGGHIVPVYHIYNKLKSLDANLKVGIVGNGTQIEKAFFQSNKDYSIITTGKAYRRISLANLWQLILFFVGIFQSLKFLRSHKPKVIFSKGSYVSLPFIFWAKILKIPYFIHESDTVMGLSNRFAASKAKLIFTGFPVKYYDKKIQKRIVFTGQISEVSESSVHFDFGFTNKKPIVLVTGGSLGAQSLNKQVYRSLPVLLKSYNVIHQTGTLGYREGIERRAGLSEELRNSYFVCDFLPSDSANDLKSAALSIADLVISRAGATTMGEIALAKKPMILVPYPYASSDHQTKNVEALTKAHGCLAINDRELNPEILIRKIDSIIDDEKKTKEMVKNASDFFPTNGLDIITKEILKEVK